MLALVVFECTIDGFFLLLLKEAVFLADRDSPGFKLGLWEMEVLTACFVAFFRRFNCLKFLVH